jgi:hypothetical protein
MLEGACNCGQTSNLSRLLGQPWRFYAGVFPFSSIMLGLRGRTSVLAVPKVSYIQGLSDEDAHSQMFNLCVFFAFLQPYICLIIWSFTSQ